MRNKFIINKKSCHLYYFNILVTCSNTDCHHINKIATGKKHGRVWDANTKLATAMIHTGMNTSQVNNFLAAINIPPVSEKVITNRMKESGLSVEEIAKESMQEAISEERLLTHEKQGADAITASVDAGWQKRGSGRSYDSLSGTQRTLAYPLGNLPDKEQFLMTSEEPREKH